MHGVRSSPLQKYAFGGGDKLSLAASSPVVGNFSKRGSVPVVSAVSADATQAVVWEVCGQPCTPPPQWGAICCAIAL